MITILKYAVATLCFILLSHAAIADWQSDLESEFDIVETFDGLNDWPVTSGDVASINRGTNTDSAVMPTLTGGGSSMWNMFDYWPTSDTTVDWIADHGAVNRIGGSGKSLRMDITQNLTPGDGPGRFGLYFTNGNGYSTSGAINSGYNEVYIFYRLKLPYNHFPGREIDQTYDQAEYWAYYKFNTICAGFYSVNNPYDTYADADGQGKTYGVSYEITDIKTGASYADGLVFLSAFRLDTVNDTDFAQWLFYNNEFAYDAGASSNISPLLGDSIGDEEWFGFEMRKSVGTQGNADGVHQVWIYDSSGNATLVQDLSNIEALETGENYNYNKFFFGGNLSFDETGLDTTYYIDDFIINDSRVGPTYFTLLAAYTPTSPIVTAPSNQSISGTSYTLSGASAVIESGRTVTSCTWSSDQGESGSLSTSGTAPNITISGDISGLAQGTEDIVHTITITVVDAPNGETGDDTFDITVQGTGTGGGTVTVSNAGTVRTISNTGTAQIVGN